MISSLFIDREEKQKHVDLMSYLNRVEHNVSSIGMSFPDVTSFDFKLELNKWKTLPESISSGVKTMGLHIGKDYRACLVHYEKNAYIDPHYHSREIEVIRVLKGKIVNKRNGKEYREGELMTIEKGDIHFIVAKSDEVYMYIVFSESERVIEKLFFKEYL